MQNFDIKLTNGQTDGQPMYRMNKRTNKQMEGMTKAIYGTP